jgi:cytochrome c
LRRCDQTRTSSPLSDVASTPALAEEAGARLFEPCRACHSLEPGERGLPGPNLSGLLKRKVGADDAFDYSPALRRARDEGLGWDEARLDRFLTDPAAMFPGLWMATRGIEEVADRRALVRFLADTSSR